MGNPGAGTHYLDSSSIVVDVSDIIYQISPQSKPFFNMIGDSRAISFRHEWQTRELTTYQYNASVEGFTYDLNTEMTHPSREENLTQILSKEIRVSNSTQAMGHYGISNPFGDQMSLRMAEWGTDVEAALIAGTTSSGATNNAQEMAGIVQAIHSGASTYTSYAGAATLSEENFNDTIEACWELGGEPRDCFVKGDLKRKISGFTSSNTHFLKADERRVISSVGLYETDFFPVEIHLTRVLPPTPQASNGTNQTGQGFLLVDRSMLSKAWLRRAVAKRIPETADSDDGVIVGELTLEFGHRSAHWFTGNVDKDGL